MKFYDSKRAKIVKKSEYETIEINLEISELLKVPMMMAITSLRTQIKSALEENPMTDFNRCNFVFATDAKTEEEEIFAVEESTFIFLQTIRSLVECEREADERVPHSFQNKFEDINITMTALEVLFTNVMKVRDIAITIKNYKGDIIIAMIEEDI